MHIRNTLSVLLFLPLIGALPTAGLEPNIAERTTSKKTEMLSVIYPSSGCNKKTCTASGSTYTCKRDSPFTTVSTPDEYTYLLERTDTTYGSLSVPAAKTEAGVTAWTKTVLASASNKNLDLGASLPGSPPTSQFIKWGSSDVFASIQGLYGCTSIVIVSRCGVYQTHHWQMAVNDQAYAMAPIFFRNSVTRALQGQGKEDSSTMADTDGVGEAIMKFARQEADEMYPSSTAHWTPLTGATGVMTTDPTCFAAANKPKVLIVTGGDGKTELFPTAVDAIKTLVNTLVPGSNPAIVTYKVTNKADSESSSNMNGKVIVTFSPATGAANNHAYQVWIGGNDVTKPVYEDSWKV